MTNSNDRIIRAAATIGMLGAVRTVALGAIIQLVVQPSTNISDGMWSYPLSSRALVPMSVLYAAIHVLVIVGMLASSAAGWQDPAKQRTPSRGTPSPPSPLPRHRISCRRGEKRRCGTVACRGRRSSVVN